MPTRQAGRIAGSLYLAVVVTGIFSLAYAPNQLFLSGESPGALDHLRSQVPLLVAQVAGTLAMSACFLLLPFSLARLLSAWGPGTARLMIVLVILSLPPTWLAAMQLGELAFSLADQTATDIDLAAARAGYRQWIGIASIFWGLWLAPLGLLVFRSGILPRLLGLCLLLGSVGYVVDTAGRLLTSVYADWAVADWVTLPASIGELGTCAWLLIFGVRDRPPSRHKPGRKKVKENPIPPDSPQAGIGNRRCAVGTSFAQRRHRQLARVIPGGVTGLEWVQRRGVPPPRGPRRRPDCLQAVCAA